MDQNPGWPRRLSDVIANEVRRRRLEVGLSAQQLADECERLGYPLARAVLSHLENGRRENISVTELLVLAKALRTEPIFLIAPVGYVENIELLPGVQVSAEDAVTWIAGDPTRSDRSAAGVRTVYKIIGEERYLAQNLESVLENGMEDQAGVDAIAQRLERLHQRDDELLLAKRSLERELPRTWDHSLPEEEWPKEIRQLRDLRQQSNEMFEQIKQVRPIESAGRQFGGDRFGSGVESLMAVRSEMRSRGMIVPPLPPRLAARVGEESPE